MTTTMIAPVTMNASATTAVSQPRLIALEGSPAPAEIGGTYSKIISAAVDNSGDVVFSATLSDSTASSAILLKSGDTTRMLLRSGDKAPDGSTYKKFDELDGSYYKREDGRDGRFLIFRAELESSSVSEGLFLWTPAGVQAIALEDGQSPMGNTYKSFVQPMVISETSIKGVVPLYAFVAIMEDGKKSFIMVPDFAVGRPDDASSQEFLSTGLVLGDKVVEDFVISRLGAEGVSCIAQVRNLNDNTSYKEFIFVGYGYIHHGGPIRQGAKLKPIGKIRRFVTPPSIFFQNGVAILQLKGGTRALVTQDVLLGPVILAKTGDPAPGLIGKTLQGFGSPVSTPDWPVADTPFSARVPTGIVCPVQLGGGQSALWLWTRKVAFPGPDIIETKLLLVGGKTDDGQGPMLQSFSPINITNRGALLLRGTVGEGGQAREGLFVIEGLFDEQPQ